MGSPTLVEFVVEPSCADESPNARITTFRRSIVSQDAEIQIPDTDYDFVVVANRLPVDRITNEDGSPGWRRSPGGLVTALAPIMAASTGAWVGWHGATD